MRLAVLDQGREPVALCSASGCDSGRGRGGGASGGPSGVPCLGRGISEDRMSLKRVLGPRFWLVGAQWSQRCFSSAAQSSKPSQRRGRTRVELKCTRRSGRHASVFFPQGFCDEPRQDSGCLWLRSRAVGAAPLLARRRSQLWPSRGPVCICTSVSRGRPRGAVCMCTPSPDESPLPLRFSGIWVCQLAEEGLA